MNATRIGSLLLAIGLAATASVAAQGASAGGSRESPADQARPSRPDPLKSIQAQVEAAFRARDYGAAIALAQRHAREGGSDPRVRALLVRSQFELGDFENAARGLHAGVELAERAGQRPADEDLALLAACYVRLNDITGEVWALEKRVTYYPKPEHWAELIARTEKRGSFTAGLALDLWRIKLATGAITGAAGYLQAATLAQQAGSPAEARAMLDKGFASGALGTGPDADRHRRLREQVQRQYADAQRRLANGETPAGSVGSDPVGAGFIQVSFGDQARGIAAMEAGLQKAGSNRPQIDKLHLGIAYLMAGRKTDAIAAFKTVTGVHGAADLGRLWYLHALRLAMP